MGPIEKFKNYLKNKPNPNDSAKEVLEKFERQAAADIQEEIDNEILSQLMEIIDETKEEKSSRKIQKVSKK